MKFAFLFFETLYRNSFLAAIQLLVPNAPDGAMRRATIVVCAKSGTEVPRYGVRVSPKKSFFVKAGQLLKGLTLRRYPTPLADWRA